MEIYFVSTIAIRYGILCISRYRIDKAGGPTGSSDNLARDCDGDGNIDLLSILKAMSAKCKHVIVLSIDYFSSTFCIEQQYAIFPDGDRTISARCQ